MFHVEHFALLTSGPGRHKASVSAVDIASGGQSGASSLEERIVMHQPDRLDRATRETPGMEMRFL